ncbi:hypothetical protein ES703_115402 [subsurface metagenome]
MWTGNPNIGMEPREFTAYDAEWCINNTWELYIEEGSTTYAEKLFLKSVTAPDRYTLVFEFNEFSAIWMYRIGVGCGAMASMIPQETEDAGPADWRNACGTGPFIITDYVEGSQATFERNPIYWDTTTIDGKEYPLPFVDKVVFPIIPDVSTQIAALRTGQVDLQIAVPPEYSASLAKTCPALIQTGYLRASADNAYLQAIEGHFSDRNVRRALMIGTDYEAIVNTMYPAAGGEIHCYPVNSDTVFYTPLDDLPAETKMLFDYNPDLARQMLADAGYPDGFKMEFNCGSSPEYQDLVSLLIDMWGKIGIDCEMIVLDDAAHSVVRGEHTQKDIAGCRMVTTDPYNSLNHGLYPDHFGAWEDEYFTEEFARVKLMRDPVERVEAVKKLCIYYLNEVSSMAFVNPYLISGYWPWLKNYYGELENGYYNFHQMISRLWLDQNMKAEMGF